jgi:hypothetical protein
MSGSRAPTTCVQFSFKENRSLIYLDTCNRVLEENSSLFLLCTFCKGHHGLEFVPCFPTVLSVGAFLWNDLVSVDV